MFIILHSLQCEHRAGSRNKSNKNVYAFNHKHILGELCFVYKTEPAVYWRFPYRVGTSKDLPVGLKHSYLERYCQFEYKSIVFEGFKLSHCSYYFGMCLLSRSFDLYFAFIWKFKQFRLVHVVQLRSGVIFVRWRSSIWKRLPFRH